MPTRTHSIIRAIVITGFIAGTLDAVAAVINYYIKTGKNPIKIFNYIASAVFGQEKAYEDGTSMVFAGVLFHYLIAFLFTIVFFVIYPKLKLLSKNLLLSGLCYGIIIWLVMNKLILPLTNIAKPATPPVFNLGMTLTQIGILMLFVGLPISILTGRYYAYKKQL